MPVCLFGDLIRFCSLEIKHGSTDWLIRWPQRLVLTGPRTKKTILLKDGGKTPKPNFIFDNTHGLTSYFLTGLF